MILWSDFKLAPSRIDHLKLYFEKPEDMCIWSLRDFHKLNGISHKSIKEIEDVLNIHGLKLKTCAVKEKKRRIRRVP